mmetsp:Transcript_114759/g.180705  ORF Transcript_114759/g.180705 Transcript_114759/m.180705 type:complete len:221 (-) Transcript_114759:104-766(-)
MLKGVAHLFDADSHHVHASAFLDNKVIEGLDKVKEHMLEVQENLDLYNFVRADSSKAAGHLARMKPVMDGPAHLPEWAVAIDWINKMKKPSDMMDPPETWEGKAFDGVLHSMNGAMNALKDELSIWHQGQKETLFARDQEIWQAAKEAKKIAQLSKRMLSERGEQERVHEQPVSQQSVAAALPLLMTSSENELLWTRHQHAKRCRTSLKNASHQAFLFES